MARELAIDVVLNSQDAQAELIKLYQNFRAAGDSALEASEKVEKFEKAYRDNSGKAEAKKALDKLRGANDDAADAARRHAEQSRALSSAVMQYAGPAVVIAAAKKTLEWADAIDEAAKRTNLSTTYVQQLTKVAEKNGTTFQTMAGLIQASEQRLADGNKKTVESIRSMGLSLDELLKLSPEERFRKLATAISGIEDPAKQSAVQMAVFGRAADGAAPALKAVAEGADLVESALGPEFIRAGAEAQGMIESLTNRVLELGKALILLPSVIGTSLGEFGRDSTLGTMFEMMGLHGSRKSPYASVPGMPAAPGGGFGMPSPLAPGGDPFAPGGVGGNSISFIEQSLRLGRTAAGRSRAGAKILPFRNIAGSNAASLFAFANTNYGLGNFGLDFQSSMPLLESSGSPLSFMNGMQLPGGVPMYSAGTQGGFGNWLKGNKGKIGAAAGSMLAGYLGGKIGGKAGGALSGAAQGAQMGMMFGPWGAAVGGVIGGVAGWIGAGKAAKNKKNAEISQVYEQFTSEPFIAMQKEADRLGISLEKALKAKNMKDFTAAVEEATGKIKQMTDLEDEIKRLTEATTVDFDKMNAVVQEFGLDISKLGPAFQQAALDKEAQRIIDAFAIMEKGGADMNGVLEGMADEISKLVQDSIKFGTTIPENMRPWIEELIKSGKLVDENGNAITDISKLKFGAAMESEMSKLTKKLDEMVAKLAELVEVFNQARDAANEFSDAAGNAGDAPNPGENGGGGGSGNNENGFSTGGVVGRDFRRPGNDDIFRAYLRRGERVLPAGAAAGGGITINGLSVGSFSSRSDAVEEIGDAVVRYIERRGGRLVA